MEQWYYLLRSPFASLDPAAQQWVYRSFYQFVYKDVYFKTHDHSLTEDIIQEAFLKASRQGPHLQSDTLQVKYEYISWPAAGYFPEEIFAPNDPWSLSRTRELRSLPSRITSRRINGSRMRSESPPRAMPSVHGRCPAIKKRRATASFR